MEVLFPVLWAKSFCLLEMGRFEEAEAIRAVIGVPGDSKAAYLSILGEALIRVLSALVDALSTAFKSRT